MGAEPSGPGLGAGPGVLGPAATAAPSPSCFPSVEGSDHGAHSEGCCGVQADVPWEPWGPKPQVDSGPEETSLLPAAEEPGLGAACGRDAIFLPAPWGYVAVTSTCPWQASSSAALSPGPELLPSRLDDPLGQRSWGTARCSPTVLPPFRTKGTVSCVWRLTRHYPSMLGGGGRSVAHKLAKPGEAAQVWCARFRP